MKLTYSEMKFDSTPPQEKNVNVENFFFSLHFKIQDTNANIIFQAK